jgi:hypothetical protein
MPLSVKLPIANPRITTPLGALIVGAAIDRWSPRAAIGLGASTAMLAGLVLSVIAARAHSRSDAE